MAIKGKYHYNGLEVGNLSLGQNGFLVHSTTGSAVTGTFCAIKNVTDPDEGGLDSSSTTDPIGWVSITVSTGGPNPVSGVTFALAAGDIVYGPFTSVDLASASNDEKILIYYG